MPRFLLSFLVLLVSIATPLMAQNDSLINPSRFEKGSHERFYEAFETSGETYYADVVSAYRDYCQSRYAEPQVVIEWCEFISYFTYSEDFYFETAEADYEEALAFLKERYGNTPEAILFELGNEYGDDFFNLARDIEPKTNQWSNENLGNLHLMYANRHYWNDDLLNAQISAKRAYSLDRNIDSALLLLNIYRDFGKMAEASEIFDTGIFQDASDWQRKQVMDALFALEKPESALEIYHKIKDSEDVYFDKSELAGILASQNNVEQGREVLSEIEINEWNEQQTLFNRLKFEFDHGTPDSVWSAYDEYRKLGWHQDPLGRMCFELALRTGSIPSFGSTLPGLLSFFVLLTVSCLLPLIVILPIHYWYLRKAIRGQVKISPLGPWDLRSLWFCLATIIFVDMALLWLANETALTLLFFDDINILNQVPFISDIQLLKYEYLTYTIIFGLLFWRVGGIRLLGTTEWSVGKSIGIGMAMFIPIRILSGIHSSIFEDLSYTISQSNALTSTIFQDLLDAQGLWGLLLYIGFIGPVLEEILFRGIILSAAAKRIPFWAANTTQSILFALIHEDLRLIVFYICFGLICGWLVKKSKGLIGAFSLHILNNTLVCLAIYLMSKAS